MSREDNSSEQARMLEKQRLYEVKLKPGEDSESICRVLREAGILETEVFWIVPKHNGTISLNSSVMAVEHLRRCDAVDTVVEINVEVH